MCFDFCFHTNFVQSDCNREFKESINFSSDLGCDCFQFHLFSYSWERFFVSQQCLFVDSFDMFKRNHKIGRYQRAEKDVVLDMRCLFVQMSGL